MSIYVGMDVHRKRSQVAVLDDAGGQQRNRNVPNDPAQLVPILGALPPGTPVASTTGSFSQPITGGAVLSAVSGSLRPWPVSTQTTVRGLSLPGAAGKPWARMPATDAAEAGSQKTPSREASSR